jgi:putative peptidoglycan lipid II flippase
MSDSGLELLERSTDGGPARAARSATFIGGFALAASVTERLATFGLIVLIASVYGSGSAADLYFIASIGPLLLGSLLGQTIATTVLPLLVRRSGDHGSKLLAAGLWLTVAIMVVATAAYTGVAIVVARVAAPGGSTSLGPWLAFAPIMLLLGLSSYLSAVLLYQQRYVWPPFRTAAASIAGLAFVAPILAFTHRLEFAALGITAGYAVSCALMLLETRDTGALFARPDRASAVELFGLWRNAGLAGLSSLVGGQAFVLVERVLASSMGVGAVSSISYARGIAFTPNILGQAVATGVYPGMVRAYERHEVDVVRDALLRGLRLTTFFALSLATYFAAFGVPVTSALLQRGAFGSVASSETGKVLSVFALALAGNLIVILTSRVFSAIDFFSGALWCQGVVLVVYVVVAIPFRAAWGLSGLALAFGIAEMAGAVTGLVLAARRLHLAPRILGSATFLPAIRRAGVVCAALLVLRVGIAHDGVSTRDAPLIHAGGSLVVLSIVVAVTLWTARWPETERVKHILRDALARLR